MEKIPENERLYIRELAKEQLELANLEEMKVKKQHWYQHNALQSDVPIIVVEENTFMADILPKPFCSHPVTQMIENKIQRVLCSYHCSHDDKVIPDYIEIPLQIRAKWFGIDTAQTRASEGVGYHIEPVLVSLREDFSKLSASDFQYDEIGTQTTAETVQELVGDILPIRLKNTFNHWMAGITGHVIRLMGMENMFCSIMDEPDEYHKLMDFITNEIIRCLRWQEEKNILLPNSENDYMGSGSYCFNYTLAQYGAQNVTSQDTWGHTNSQESVGLSRAMYHEFMYPYFYKLAQQFGALYYGCCEPVDTFWDDSISQYPNLKKVSISPWCDETFMAQRLEHTDIIYSRKPSPNFIGIHKEFDEAAFRSYIQKTLELTKNCHKEFIFRDIYSLHGNIEKVGRAVEVIRKLCN